MPTGDIMRLTLEGIFCGEPTVLSFGFVSNSGAADFQTDADALATEFAAALDLGSVPGAYLAPLSNHYILQNIRVQDLSPGVAASYVDGYGGVGGNAIDDAMPPQIALCVTWRTNLKGQANRGRTYLTGFAEDSHSGGYWIEEIQAWAGLAVADPLMAAFGPVGSGNYALSVIHTVSGGARLVPPTATPIVGYTVHNETRTLRRRGPGVRISRPS